MKLLHSANACSAGGADKSGVFHWLMQRVTAVVLIPLPLWVVLFLKQLLHASPEQLAAWVLSGWLNRVFLAFLTLAAVYHAVLGIQSIFHDYISSERRKTVSMWLVRLVFSLTLLAVFYTLWQAGSME